MKKLKLIFFILSLFFISNFVSAQEEIEINFFYSRTCPHCAKEEIFLDKLEKKYPQIKINRYLIEDPKNIPFLKELCRECRVEEYLGLVPIIFIEKEPFSGFDNEKNIGRKIENSVRQKLGLRPLSAGDESNQINLPLLGKIDVNKYSLPALAVILGFFDGINVCSLETLVLILGLVLVLKSKRKSLILGGSFILTTAIIYGILIILWYQIFLIFSPYIRKIELVIGILTLLAGGYFLKEFLKSKKQGPTCEIKSFSTKLGQKIQTSFKERTNILALIGVVFLFAAVIAIVEFPCSAVLPVIFAGILSQANLTVFLYLFYITIFLFFYLLDEIIVFLVAVFTMKIWLISPKFTTWLYLVAATMLFFLGIYRLWGLMS